MDPTHPGVYWVIRQHCLITPVRPDFKRFTHANTSSAWVAVQVFQLVLLYKLMVDKESYKETKHVLENYGRQQKTLLSFQSR